MTTAKLKDYYLAFWLKPEMAATRTARVAWGLGLLLVFLGVAASVMMIVTVLADAFLAVGMVRSVVLLLSTGLVLFVSLWLLSRPSKWREEREIEHTADLRDDHRVTLNLRTANGVDYADKALGDFLLNRLAEAVGEWECRKC